MDEEATDQATGAEREGARLPVDGLLSLLAHRHRRVVLRELAANPDGPVSVDDLAERVLQRRDTNDHGASTAGRRRVRLALHHVHLPALDAHGLVEYDDATVRLRDVHRPELEAVLSAVDPYDPVA